MKKSPDAFRTISEVAEWLDVPTHVLRFWESRFSQIKPVKRAGGRRYYRPSDMRLIGGVKVLLHDQGMTIRSVQKSLREQGIKHVSSFSPHLDGEDAEDDTDTVIDHVPAIEDTPTPTEPAPAARSTREATRAPVTSETAEETPAFSSEREIEADDDQPDMFADHGGAQDIDEVPEIEDTPPPPPPVEPEDDPVLPDDAGPVEPLGADLPLDDPSDTSEAHLKGPGVAARLAVLPRADLARHRDALQAARDALLRLRDKAS